MKNKVRCLNCDCFLREKWVKKDWKERELCVSCFKSGNYSITEISRKRIKKSIINFGKYKGKEYNYVLENDDKYCKWIYEKSINTEFSNNNFIKYLSNIYNDGTKSTI
tara:strand:- start:4144 stop:4467 length:324 start_codon:yes stop_codon:yes gene_type:complete